MGAFLIGGPKRRLITLVPGASALNSRQADPATSIRHPSGVDEDAYRFACALLAAREVDRAAAAMICQQAREGRISLDEAIGALRTVETKSV